MVDGFRYVIVGSGFAGAVLAERIATVLDEPVLVLEKRAHIGGNAYSSLDPETGIECHRYGSHIFHTRHEDVWGYVTRFGAFTEYRHHVMTEHAGRVYSMPISLDTINSFYGTKLKPFEVEAFIRQEAGTAGISEPKNLEEKAISLIGRPLYEAFIKGYTHKQWNRDPRELPSDIITRLPVRDDYNTCYFSDPHQGIPKDGYGRLFENLLADPRITVRLETEFSGELKRRAVSDPDVLIIYTGMIDDYFEYAFGGLAWRSLRFEYETVDVRDYQGVSVMNYADTEVPFTRIHEFKHYHPERAEVFASYHSVICREYPQDFERGLEPYYPVSDTANQTLYQKYRDQARSGRTLFCGRLGAYRYSDMDGAIELALDLFEDCIRPAHNADGPDTAKAVDLWTKSR